MIGVADGIDGVVQRLVPHVDRLRRRTVHRRRLARALDPVPAILAGLPADRVGDPGGWVLSRRLWSATGIAIAVAGPANEDARVVVKIASDDHAAAALASSRMRLERLAGDERLSDWSALLPRVLDHGRVDDAEYLVETAMPGVPAQRLLRHPAARARLLPAAAASIAQLHRRTRAPHLVDERSLTEWVDGPVDSLVASVGPSALEPDAVDLLERLRKALRSRLAGRRVYVGWIHGDYWPGNLLASADGATVTGIVDWDQADPAGLPTHDALHLVLYSRRLLAQREFGDVVVGFLGGDPLDHIERASLDIALDPTDPEELRLGAILAWLRHVATFAPVPGHGTSRRWVRRNIVTVLRAVDGPMAGAGEGRWL